MFLNGLHSPTEQLFAKGPFHVLPARCAFILRASVLRKSCTVALNGLQNCFVLKFRHHKVSMASRQRQPFAPGSFSSYCLRADTYVRNTCVLAHTHLYLRVFVCKSRHTVQLLCWPLVSCRDLSLSSLNSLLRLLALCAQPQRSPLKREHILYYCVVSYVLP